MNMRNKAEQSEHDLVVEASASTYRATGGTAYTNPGSEKNCQIEGLYPDVVAKKADGSTIIEEIETETTVTKDDCNNQWKPYSKLGYSFILVVPKGKADEAQSLLRDSKVDASLQMYTISGNDVIFYDSQGKRMVT